MANNRIAADSELRSRLLALRAELEETRTDRHRPLTADQRHAMARVAGSR